MSASSNPLREDQPCDWFVTPMGYWCRLHNSGNVYRKSHTDMARDDPDPLRVPTDVDQAYADGFADAWDATKPRVGAGVWLGCLLLMVAIAAGIAVGAFVIAPILAAHG